jgi:hypothetical protein
MTNDITKQITDAAEKMKQFVPQINVSKNGYEIRAQMLEMAQSQLWNDYHARWGAFETSITKDGKEVITKVEMPSVPGVEQVLDAAEKFYAFVNQNSKK